MTTFTFKHYCQNVIKSSIFSTHVWWQRCACVHTSNFPRYIHKKQVDARLSADGHIKLAHEVFDNHLDNGNPPLYILHGLFGSKSNWKSLAKAFARKRKVITVDSRNHGASPQCMEINYDLMCEDLRELIRDLGHEKLTLMGHSMGGKTCIHLALRYPELVDKLVIVDVSPARSPSNMEEILDALIHLKFDHKLSLHAARKQADADLKVKLQDEGLRHFLLTNLVKKDHFFKLKVDPHIIKTNIDQIMGFPDLGHLTFRGDTLFIGGANSKYINAETEPIIRRYFPNVKIVFVPNAGHWVHAEQPRLFLQAVEDFLEKS